MSNKVTLYDLPCRGRCASWSPNVWKTRMVLNYKQIPYQTTWLPHPEIAPTLQGLGIPPNDQSKPGPPISLYSLPTVQLPDGSYVMESSAIAIELEKMHPEPSLHLDNGLAQKIGPIIGRISFPLIPVFMPRIGRNVIIESSVDYFQEARAKRFGMSLDELEKEKGGDPAWAASRPGMEELNAFIAAQKKDEGPFILGGELCYADFVVAGMVEALRRIGEDLYEKMREMAGPKGVMEVHAACGRWFEQDQ